MTITLIRHGETIDNLNRICQGQTHGILTATGISQAHNVARRLLHNHYECCYTSDLERAHHTARIICSQLGIPLFPDARLRERGLGRLQGQPLPVGENGFGEWEGAERLEALRMRVADFVAEVSRRHHEQVLVVSHGVTLRMMVNLCTGEENYPPPMGNCSLSQLRLVSGDTFELIEYNTI